MKLRFQIPIVSAIPDARMPASKNFPDSGIRITRHEETAKYFEIKADDKYTSGGTIF